VLEIHQHAVGRRVARDMRDLGIADRHKRAAGRAAHRRVQQANDAIMAEQLSAWSTDELVDLVDRLEHLIVDLRTSPDARRGATEHE
jgi:hypothetical protein